MRYRWWQYFLWRPALYGAIRSLSRVLVRSRVSNTHALAFARTDTVLSDATVVFAFQDWAAFTCLQSRVHEEWARSHASTMRNDLRYTPTSCFQTFPFPVAWKQMTSLESVGEAYYQFRAALMLKNNEGLTKTYNRFHDSDDRDPEIVKLRELHTAVDRALLAAYGWGDIPTHCEFLLEYDIDEEERGNKKKPWRYRWPDEVRDEVLARLLDLNGQRAGEEALSGTAAADGRGQKNRKRTPARRPANVIEAEQMF